MHETNKQYIKKLSKNGVIKDVKKFFYSMSGECKDVKKWKKKTLNTEVLIYPVYKKVMRLQRNLMRGGRA